MYDLVKKTFGSALNRHYAFVMTSSIEWAKEVADRVADIKKLATNKDTSLYQATELLKQAEPSFSFICDVERSKFELKLESSAKLQSFDQTYKKQIEASLKDDVTDADKDKLTKEYKQQLGKFQSCTNLMLFMRMRQMTHSFSRSL